MTLKSGLRLAWRQHFEHPKESPSAFSDLTHRHSTTVFPFSEREALERICASVNEGYRLEDGSPSIIQWVEEYGEQHCDGNYWGILVDRKKRT